MHRTNHLVSFLGAALLTACGARADVLVDTFDSGGTFSPSVNLPCATATHAGSSNNSVRLAVRFQVPPCQPGYSLDSIRIPISQSFVNNTQTLLRVRIAADAGGGPGATVETVSENVAVPTQATPFSTPTTFNSTAHPLLIPGAYYWVITELTAWPNSAATTVNVDHRWYNSISGPTSTYIQQSVAAPTVPTDPWPSTTATARLALRVNGTPVPILACCGPTSGGCALITAAACTALGLAQQGAGSVCDPNPCATGTGACCTGASCAFTSQNLCAGTYLGAGAVCAPILRYGVMNACCPADVTNSSGLDVDDILQFLNRWFAGCH